MVLPTVSQYIYSIFIKVNFEYAEYTDIQSIYSVLPYRTNNDGGNVSNGNAKSLQVVNYDIFLNNENNQQYSNDNVNCSNITLDNNTGNIVNPIYIPLNISATAVK